MKNALYILLGFLVFLPACSNSAAEEEAAKQEAADALANVLMAQVQAAFDSGPVRGGFTDEQRAPVTDVVELGDIAKLSRVWTILREAEFLTNTDADWMSYDEVRELDDSTAAISGIIDEIDALLTEDSRKLAEYRVLQNQIADELDIPTEYVRIFFECNDLDHGIQPNGFGYSVDGVVTLIRILGIQQC